MKFLLTILFLSSVLIGKSQTIGAVTEQAVSGAGNMVYFISNGYLTADAAHRLFISLRPGVGATNFANIKNESPFKELDNGTKTGKFIDKLGDTVYCMYEGGYTGSDPCTDLVKHMDYIFTNWSSYIDSGSMKSLYRFVRVGYSQGGQDIGKTLTTFCNDNISSTEKYRHFFHKIGGAESGDWHNLTQLQSLNQPLMCWMWHDNVSPATTFPSSSQAVYDNIAIGNPNSPYSVKIKLYDCTHSTGDDSLWRQPVDADDATTSFEVWAHDTSDVPPPLAKITGIHYRDIIQITGQGLTFDAALCFDEQGADPANGVNTPEPTTTNISTYPIHFSSFLNNEHRYVVDLRGRHALNKVYFYSDNSFFDDSVIIYKGDFKIGWTRIGAIRITVGMDGWNSINLPGTDTSSFLAIGHKGTWETLYGKNGIADVREIIIYGDLIGARIAVPKSYPYTGSVRETPLMKNYAGINHQTGYVKMKYLRQKTNHRQGLQMEWMESADGLLDYPNNTYDMDNFGLLAAAPYKLERYVADSIHNKLNQNYFTFIINCNARYIDQGGPTEGHFVNNFGDNPYLFASYTRIGNYHWTRAAMYGLTEVDTNLIRITGLPKYSGLGTMSEYENGNEVDKFWGGQDSMTGAESDKLFISPLSYVIQSQMDYDGHEGRYWPYIGIKYADPNAYLLQAGTVGGDTGLVESRTKISRFQRDDSADIFEHAFNFHYYPSNATEGLHPAFDSTALKFMKVVDNCYRQDSVKQVIVSEAGFDTKSGSGSNYAMAHSDSYSNRQTQAIGRLFLKVEFSRAKVDKLIIYNMNWNAAEADGGAYQGSQEMKDFPADSLQTSHFTDFQFDSLLANYKYNSTISYGWQTQYNIKYVSSTNVDSAIHFVAYPNVSGSTNSASINVGIGKIVQKYTFSLTGYGGTLSSPTYDSGTGIVSMTLEGMPFLLITVNQVQTPVQQTIFRNRVIRSQ